MSEIEGLVRPNERVDDLQRNGYKIIQDPKKFCFGIDAVLLSGFAQAKLGDHVLDLGTGSGIIPILLEAKTRGRHFTGLEIQPDMADMAARSVALNGLQDKVDIVAGDLREATGTFGKASFQVVTANPPYMKADSGLHNPRSAQNIARHEVLCTLNDVITQAAELLVPQGHFYMIHRPERLTEILCLMHSRKLEPKRLRFVYPYVESAANMVLVEGVRGGNPGLITEKPLIVYSEPGQYTDEIYEVYGY